MLFAQNTLDNNPGDMFYKHIMGVSSWGCLLPSPGITPGSQHEMHADSIPAGPFFPGTPELDLPRSMVLKLTLKEDSVVKAGSLPGSSNHYHMFLVLWKPPEKHFRLLFCFIPGL